MARLIDIDPGAEDDVEKLRDDVRKLCKALKVNDDSNVTFQALYI